MGYGREKSNVETRRMQEFEAEIRWIEDRLEDIDSGQVLPEETSAVLSQLSQDLNILERRLARPLNAYEDDIAEHVATLILNVNKRAAQAPVPTKQRNHNGLSDFTSSSQHVFSSAQNELEALSNMRKKETYQSSASQDYDWSGSERRDTSERRGTFTGAYIGSERRDAKERRTEAQTDGRLNTIEKHIARLSENLESTNSYQASSNDMQSLRRDIAAIGASLSQLAPKRSLESLESSIRDLGTRLESSKEIDLDKVIMAMGRLVHDMKSAVDNISPDRLLEGVESEVKALSRKFEIASSKGIDPTAFARLQHQISEVREQMEKAIQPEAFERFTSLVDSLADKLSVIDTPAALLETLQRIEQASTDLAQGMNKTGPEVLAKEFENVLSPLFARMENVLNEATTSDGTVADGIVSELQSIQSSIAALSPEHYLGAIAERFNSIDDALGAMGAPVSGVDYSKQINTLDMKFQDSIYELKSSLQSVLDDIGTVLHQQTQAILSASETDENFTQDLAQAVSAAILEKQIPNSNNDALLYDIQADIATRFAELSARASGAEEAIGDRVAQEVGKVSTVIAQREQHLIEAIENKMVDISSAIEKGTNSANSIDEKINGIVNTLEQNNISTLQALQNQGQDIQQTLNTQYEQLIGSLQSKLTNVTHQYEQTDQVIPSDIQDYLQNLSGQIASLQNAMANMAPQENSQDEILAAIHQRYDTLSDEINVLSSSIQDQKKSSKADKTIDNIYAKLDVITDTVSTLGKSLKSEKATSSGTDQETLKLLNKRFDGITSDIQTLTTALGSKDHKKGAGVNASAVNNAKLAKSVETLSEELAHLSGAVEALINGAQELASDSESNKQAFQSLEKTLQFIDKKLENQFDIQALVSEVEDIKSTLPETIKACLKGNTASSNSIEKSEIQKRFDRIEEQLKEIAKGGKTNLQTDAFDKQFAQIQALLEKQTAPAQSASFEKDIKSKIDELLIALNESTSFTAKGIDERISEVQRQLQNIEKGVSQQTQDVDWTDLSSELRAQQESAIVAIQETLNGFLNQQHKNNTTQVSQSSIGVESAIQDLQSTLSTLSVQAQSQEQNWHSVLSAIDNVAQKIEYSGDNDQEKAAQFAQLNEIKGLIQNKGTDQSLIEALHLIQSLSGKLDQVSVQSAGLENLKAVENLERQVGRLVSQIDQSWSKINNIAIVEKLLESLHGQVSALRSESSQVANLSAQIIAREGAGQSSEALEKVLKTVSQNSQANTSTDMYRIENAISILMERQEHSERMMEKALSALQSLAPNFGATPPSSQTYFEQTSQMNNQDDVNSDAHMAQDVASDFVANTAQTTFAQEIAQSEVMAETDVEQQYSKRLAEITSSLVSTEAEAQQSEYQHIPAQNLEGLEWLKAYEKQSLENTQFKSDEQLLEPGSGVPFVKASHTQDTFGADDSAKQSYLHAARMAAQNAMNSGEERVTSTHIQQSTSIKSSLDKLSNFISNKKRPLAMAAAIALVAVGTLQVMKAISDQTTVVAINGKQQAGERVLTAQKSTTTEGTLKASQDYAEVDKSITSKGNAERILPRVEQAQVEPTAPEIIEKKEEVENNITTASIPNNVPTPRPSATLVPSMTALPDAIAPKALRAAAESGDPISAYDIGARYAEGRGVTRDFSEAARWFEKAAAQGLAPAQYRLAMQYEKGLGLGKDARLAEVWYKKAAERGNIKAMHNLAVMYSEGALGQVDYDKAIAWFREAASFGVHDSIYNLGILSARGLGVNRNLEDSYVWFSIAAQKGDKDAASKRDEIGALLQPETLNQMKERVSLFKPRTAEVIANEVSQPLAMKQKTNK